MAEGEDKGENKPWWAGYKPWWMEEKAEWRKRFGIIYQITSVGKCRNKPLPRWSEEDVQEFIASDPVYGPQLQLVRQGAKIAIGGAAVVGVASAYIFLRYSKSGLGACLGATAGAAVGWGLGDEVGSLTLGLYKMKCIEPNLKFLDWWARKSGQ